MPNVLDPPPWNLQQLIAHARQRLDDYPGDIEDETQSWTSDDAGLLWKNLELVAAADQALIEYAIRRPIKDSRTAAICQIAVVPNTASYAFDSRILAIERIKFVETDSGKVHPLTKRTHTDLDTDNPRWESHESGHPCVHIEDLDQRRLTLYKTPVLAGTLHLTVRRLPLARLNWSTGQNTRIEIPAEHHADLIDWILYQAYMKRDAETEDVNASATHYKLFETNIGPRPSAHLQRVRRMERNTHRRVRATYF